MAFCQALPKLELPSHPELADLRVRIFYRNSASGMNVAKPMTLASLFRITIVLFVRPAPCLSLSGAGIVCPYISSSDYRGQTSTIIALPFTAVKVQSQPQND